MPPIDPPRQSPKPSFILIPDLPIPQNDHDPVPSATAAWRKPHLLLSDTQFPLFSRSSSSGCLSCGIIPRALGIRRIAQRHQLPPQRIKGSVPAFRKSGMVLPKVAFANHYHPVGHRVPLSPATAKKSSENSLGSVANHRVSQSLGHDHPKSWSRLLRSAWRALKEETPSVPLQSLFPNSQKFRALADASIRSKTTPHRRVPAAEVRFAPDLGRQPETALAPTIGKDLSTRTSRIAFAETKFPSTADLGRSVSRLHDLRKTFMKLHSSPLCQSDFVHPEQDSHPLIRRCSRF